MTAKKILVVDDSPTELKMMCDPFVSKGFDVITASGGEEALKMVDSEQPSLIVLDVIMPGVSGFEVCRKIKTTEGMKHIPVILLTSKNQKSDEFWGMKQGADVYITKPFSAENLLKAASGLCRQAFKVNNGNTGFHQ